MSFNYQPQHSRLVHDTELNFRNQVGLMIFKQERKSSGKGKFLSNHQQLLEATRKLRLLMLLSLKTVILERSNLVNN